MANHFLTKSQITLQSCISVDGELALDQYDALHQVLFDKASPEAAALFAEPLISRGNAEAPPTVSWYTDIDGEDAPLASLDADARGSAEAVLSDLLGQIQPLLADPEIGRLVAAALHIANTGSLRVINGQPLILNWGMVDEGIGTDAQARKSHFASTLGRFLPLATAPPLTAAEQEAFTKAGSANESDTGAGKNAAIIAAGAAAATTATAVSVDAAETTDAQIPTAAPEQVLRENPRKGRTVPRSAWFPLLLLLLFFGLILLWLLLPGTRLFQPAQVSVVKDAQAIALTEEVNKGLRKRLATLQAAVDGAQCHADGTLVIPGGLTIEGLTPPIPDNPDDAPGTRTKASPTPILAPDPARVDLPQDASATLLSQPNLLGVLEDRTVLVLAIQNGQVSGSGSGFFIGPDHILTNFHVVNGASKIYVTNKTLGKLHDTKVINAMGPFDTTGGDFALLQVAGLNHSYYQILQSDASLKLQSVIAAGYPGDVLETDNQFTELRRGNQTSVPDLTVTDGVVNTEQSLSPTSSVVMHSAPISQGNSGGPLVDMCGRIVGVNTFVRRGNMRNLNFALSTKGILSFLDGTGTNTSVVSNTCVPQIVRPSAPPSTTVTQVQ